MGKNTKAGQEIRDQIEEGKINLIIGTHALLP
jgi:RecG-like helicase